MTSRRRRPLSRTPRRPTCSRRPAARGAPHTSSPERRLGCLITASRDPSGIAGEPPGECSAHQVRVAPAQTATTRRGREMASYLVLFDWTPEGAENVGDSPARVERAKEAFRPVGGQARDFYPAMGPTTRCSWPGRPRTRPPPGQCSRSPGRGLSARRRRASPPRTSSGGSWATCPERRRGAELAPTPRRRISRGG